MENNSIKQLKKEPPLLLFFLLVMFVPCFGTVFEESKVNAPLIAPSFIAEKSGKLTARVNSVAVKIDSFRSKMSADTIMSYYAKQAEDIKAELINGPLVREIAFKLIHMGETQRAYKWYYLIYKKKNGSARLVVSGDFASGARLLIATVEKNIDTCNNRGYDDGIKHLFGLKKELSIEILSGAGTAGFANIYKSVNIDRQSIMNYYRNYFEKNGWSVIKEDFSGKTAALIVLKGAHQYIFNIFRGGDGNNWISIIG